QHGLTPADVAENVETLDRLRLARSEQPAEGGRLARETALGQSRFEPRQPVDDRLLAGVAFNLSGGDARRILHRDGGRHEREGWSVAGGRWNSGLAPSLASRTFETAGALAINPLFDRGTVDSAIRRHQPSSAPLGALTARAPHALVWLRPSS